MIQSMTGFGKAEAEISGKKVTVEIKSLNSKQFDLSMKIAPQYREREMSIRSLLSSSLLRGKVDFVLSVENAEQSESPKLNYAVITAYYEQIKTLAEQLNESMPGIATIPMLLRLPDAIHVENPVAKDEELDQVTEIVKTATDNLLAFRKQEGEMLYQVFTEKIANIAALLDSVKPYEEERVANIRQRLSDQLQNLPVGYDKNRFEQELIYYIEKLDINEEKHRLDNHLKYFLETIRHEEAGQGKKLGFIAQEMGREINTLGSKANHAELQRIVVRMKDELEQIKEQVLNVL